MVSFCFGFCCVKLLSRHIKYNNFKLYYTSNYWVPQKMSGMVYHELKKKGWNIIRAVKYFVYFRKFENYNFSIVGWKNDYWSIILYKIFSCLLWWMKEFPRLLNILYIHIYAFFGLTMRQKKVHYCLSVKI